MEPRARSPGGGRGEVPDRRWGPLFRLSEAIATVLSARCRSLTDIGNAFNLHSTAKNGRNAADGLSELKLDLDVQFKTGRTWPLLPSFSDCRPHLPPVTRYLCDGFSLIAGHLLAWRATPAT